jgi:hypothetical protein
MDIDRHGFAGARTGKRERRTLCTLVAGSRSPAVIRDLSARGAELQTAQRLPLGASVELLHPAGGRAAGLVSGILPGGLRIAFKVDARSVAFALAVLGGPVEPARQSSTHALRG